MYLVISASLNPKSRSKALAEVAHAELKSHTQAEVELLDLQEISLPTCDGGACYAAETVQTLSRAVTAADGILIATPIYNYDVNAAIKNVVELTGKAWTEKIVGFVCAAGGHVSYMAPMGLANSLMLDFRSLILPKFVFATGKAFDENNQLVDQEIRDRVKELSQRLIFVVEALRK